MPGPRDPLPRSTFRSITPEQQNAELARNLANSPFRRPGYRAPSGPSYYGDPRVGTPTPVTPLGERLARGSPMSNAEVDQHVNNLLRQPLGVDQRLRDNFRQMNKPDFTGPGGPAVAAVRNPALWVPGSPGHEHALASQRFAALAAQPPPAWQRSAPAAPGAAVARTAEPPGADALRRSIMAGLPAHMQNTTRIGISAAPGVMIPAPGIRMAAPVAPAPLVRNGPAPVFHDEGGGVADELLDRGAGDEGAEPVAPPRAGPPVGPLPLHDPHVRGVSLDPNVRSRIPRWGGGGKIGFGVRGVMNRPPAPGAAPPAPGAAPPAGDPLTWDSIKAAAAVQADREFNLKKTAQETEAKQRDRQLALQELQDRRDAELHPLKVADAKRDSLLTLREQLLGKMMASGMPGPQAAQAIGIYDALTGPQPGVALKPGASPAPVHPDVAQSMLGATGRNPLVSADDAPLDSLEDVVGRIRELGMGPGSPEAPLVAALIRKHPAFMREHENNLYQSAPGDFFAPTPALVPGTEGFSTNTYAQAASDPMRQSWLGRRFSGLIGGYWRHSPEELLDRSRKSSDLVEGLLHPDRAQPGRGGAIPF